MNYTKQAREFYAIKVKQYNSVQEFEKDLIKVISECDETMKYQKVFYKQVLKNIKN